MKRSSWSEGVRRFPNSLKQIKELIKEVRALDLESVDFQFLKSKIADLTNGYVRQGYGWKLNNLIRARKNDVGKSFSKFDDIFSPPKEIICNYGRLNCPKESIFYASEMRDGTLHEVRARAGDVITIAQFEPVKSDIELDLFDIGVYETHCARAVGFKNPRHPIHNIKTLLHPDDIDKQVAISDFLVEEMTRLIEPGGEWGYKTTAAIAEVLWKETHMYDVVAYPSVVRNLRALNLAFSPHVINEYYRIGIVNEVLVKEITESSLNFEILKKSNMIDNEKRTFYLE